MKVPRKDGVPDSRLMPTKGRNTLTIDEHQDRLRGSKYGLLSFDEAVVVHGVDEAVRWFTQHDPDAIPKLTEGL